MCLRTPRPTIKQREEVLGTYNTYMVIIGEASLRTTFIESVGDARRFEITTRMVELSGQENREI